MSDNNNIGRPFTEEEFHEQMTRDYEKSVKVETLIQENKEIQAEIQNKKLKIQKLEIERISNLQEKLAEEDVLEREFNRGEMLKSIEDREKSILFMNKRISDHIIIAPGSLVAIASMTSNGKSTFVAHMTEGIIEHEQKSVLVLSNEETEPDVRARVSCLRTGISFGDYKANRCTPEQKVIILDDAEMLSRTKKLIVISSKTEEDAYRVTTVEGVISTIKSVNNKIGCVILDYYNNVNVSEFGSIEPWHVNNKLASELNIIKGTLSFPIIVMAQCDGIKTDKKVEDKGALDFDSNHPMYRWKGGKNLLIFATDILELVKDFDNSCSFLFAHKVRFGHGELERLHILPFDKKMQRFVEWSPQFDASVTASKVTRRSLEQGRELGLDKIFEDKK